MAQMADQTPKYKMFAKIDPRFELLQGEGFDTLLVYDLSGFKKDELKVKVDNISKSLKVTGQRILEGDKCLEFEKSFSLLKDRDTNDINAVNAKFDNGMLYVMVPKSPALNTSQFSSKSLNGVVSMQTLVIFNVVIAAVLLALVLFRC